MILPDNMPIDGSVNTSGLRIFRIRRLKHDGRYVLEEKADFAPFGVRLWSYWFCPEMRQGIAHKEGSFFRRYGTLEEAQAAAVRQMERYEMIDEHMAIREEIYSMPRGDDPRHEQQDTYYVTPFTDSFVATPRQHHPADEGSET